MRPKTNCNFLSLNKKIVIKVSIADAKNKIGIILNVISSLDNRSKAKTFCFIVLHKLNTKINPPETADANSK